MTSALPPLNFDDIEHQLYCWEDLDSNDSDQEAGEEYEEPEPQPVTYQEAAQRPSEDPVWRLI